MESNSQGAKRTLQSMKPYFPEEDIKDLTKGFEEILRSGQLTSGKYTKQFEDEFAKYIGVKHAIAADSGTATLEMIYRAIDVKGREVITPTNTHISTSNAVIYSEGTPILADIEPNLLLSVDDAFKKVTPKTKAMVIVHIGGLIHPRMDEIRERCEQKGIILIEDAAHAHGATRDGKKAGYLSRAGSFSFYPAKVMTTMEGGMVTTNDDEIDTIARELRMHGKSKAGPHVRLGYNWRMVEVNSLVGLQQLRRIEEIIEKKTKVARIYDSVFKGNDLLTLIETPPNTRNSYYKYTATLDKKLDMFKVQAELKGKYGVESGSLYYPACHLEPVYVNLFGDKSGTMPVSEDILKRTIALPIYAGMTDDDATYAADSLVSVIKGMVQ